MNLIRKIKLSEIVPVEFTETELEIIDLFKDYLKDLTIFIDEKKPSEINYMKNGKFILQIDNDKKSLKFRYMGIWEILALKYNFTHLYTQQLIMYMAGKILGVKVYLPKTFFTQAYYEIEFSYYNKITRI